MRQTIQDPDIIVRSNWDEDAHLYYKKWEKYFKVVVVDDLKKRIKTTLTTDHVKSGEVLWKKDQ